MLGLMQDWPLLLHKIIDFAAIQHARPRGGVAHHRRADASHQLPASSRSRRCAVAQRLARDGIRLGDRVATLAWNGSRHLEAWYGDRRPRRDLPHRQSPPVSRADRLDHQSRRRPHRLRRPHLRAAAGGARRQAADRRALHRPDRRGAYAGDQAAQRGRLRRHGSPRPTAISAGPSSTSAPPPGFATPRARPAIRRACSIRIARMSCIRWPAPSGDGLPVVSADAVLPIVPMFHANSWSLAFSCPMRGAKLVMPGAQARRRLGLRIAGEREGDDDGGGADRLADAAAIICRQENKKLYDAEARR